MDFRTLRTQKIQSSSLSAKARLKKKSRQLKPSARGLASSSPTSPRKKGQARGVTKQDSSLLGDHGSLSPQQQRQLCNPELRKYYLMDPCLKGAEKKAVKMYPENSQGILEYMVAPEDTLYSIASRVHSTPNQLAQMNRLYSHTVFPGQHLWVPNSRDETDVESSVLSSPPSSPLTPSAEADYDKLLDVETVVMSGGQLCLLALPSECSPTQGEEPSPIRYLRLCSRYITDRKGVVLGVLVVTPNKIIFDPYKSHPLVIENGCEEYCFTCYLDLVRTIAFYRDPSRVTFSAFSPQSKKTNSGQRKEDKDNGRLGIMYTGAQQGAMMVESHQNSGKVGGGGGDSPLCVETLSGENPSHTDPPQEEEPSRESWLCSHLEHKLDIGSRGEVEGESESGCQNRWGTLSSRRVSLLRERSVETPSVSSEGEGRDTDDRDLSQSRTEAMTPCGTVTHWKKTDKVEGSSQGDNTSGASRGNGDSGGGQSCMALVFLCLKVRVPVKKRSLFPSGLKDVKRFVLRDYWLILTQDKATELSLFLRQCRSDLCIIDGAEETLDEDFVLVDSEEELLVLEKYRDRIGEEDWEIVAVDDGKEKAFSEGNIDAELEMAPVLLGESQLLQEVQIEQICRWLPPRTVGHPWKLAYSGSTHGFSLKTLYRKLSGTDSPVLLILQDTQDQVFGVLASHSLKPSELFYGTGETFLFTFNPEFKIFPWTGENSFFIKGNLDSISFGGGSGHFGLWLEESLYYGRSHPCSTFNNCILSKTGDFYIRDIEVWIFQ
ncbi:nuclear receptor coactivator 7 isoform X2 [Latimeria chalumnae]|uniref:nuclear receptor coactivator 7 isoform X2 n=1 Tax=Latimeria chalumnae TaxID=7897 RepID=UPI0003C1A190|nr:PREDICTED: nuclear receptor coactivator 7-like isoform X2 [Latimeria chalumnae]|eukprot:XP_006008845.1 PREDICTED: nuclear receptor coactivator 7-like isoform X2 [Latimeria chalumnae]